jgi:hypothetical protein
MKICSPWILHPKHTRYLVDYWTRLQLMPEQTIQYVPITKVFQFGWASKNYGALLLLSDNTHSQTFTNLEKAKQHIDSVLKADGFKLIDTQEQWGKYMVLI